MYRRWISYVLTGGWVSSHFSSPLSFFFFFFNHNNCFFVTARFYAHQSFFWNNKLWVNEVMAGHVSKIWEISLYFYICKPPPILHPLCCSFLLLTQVRMCLYHISDLTVQHVEVSLDQYPCPGASPYWFRCSHCESHVQHWQLLPVMVSALPGYSSSSLVTTARLSPWPYMSFRGSQTPLEFYDSKNGHLFIKWWIVIRLPHTLWFLHFLSNDIRNTWCVQKEEEQEGWKEGAWESVRGQTLRWRTSQAGRVRAVLSILSTVMDSRTV